MFTLSAQGAVVSHGLTRRGGLKVGPRSAGSDPGPVAYGRGGKEVTLTDANIVLHRLNPKGLLKGQMPVDETAARTAIKTQIADPLCLSIEEAASGILRIAVSNMSRAIRAVSTEKGHDVEGFALMAFGGAGPLHAVEVAAECGVPTVLIPEAPGTMCARGILLSDVSFDFVRSELVGYDDAGWNRVVLAFREMKTQAEDWLAAEEIEPEQRALRAVIEARYVGQNHEIQVPLANIETAHISFAEAFVKAHKLEYGYSIDDRLIEIVNCRLKAIGRVPRLPRPNLAQGSSLQKAHIENRQVWFGLKWYNTPVYDRELLAPGMVLEGPAIIEEMSSTTPIAKGQCAMVDEYGNVSVEV